MDNVWSIPGYIVVSMELADGSLLDMLDLYQSEYRSRLAPVLAVNYLRQAAGGLDFLNDRRHTLEGRTVGFQHCDVKPSNLLLTGEISSSADFGLSTPTVGCKRVTARRGRSTSPPRSSSRQPVGSSDQYSLAVTYIYLRTGCSAVPAPPAEFQREYSYNRPGTGPDPGQPGRAVRPGKSPGDRADRPVVLVHGPDARPGGSRQTPGAGPDHIQWPFSVGQ